MSHISQGNLDQLYEIYDFFCVTDYIGCFYASYHLRLGDCFLELRPKIEPQDIACKKSLQKHYGLYFLFLFYFLEAMKILPDPPRFAQQSFMLLLYSSYFRTKNNPMWWEINKLCNILFIYLKSGIYDNVSNDSFSSRVFLNRQIPNTIFSQTTNSQSDIFPTRQIPNRQIPNHTISRLASIYKWRGFFGEKWRQKEQANNYVCYMASSMPYSAYKIAKCRMTNTIAH